MVSAAGSVKEAPAAVEPTPVSFAQKPFRVRPVMRQGTASSIPETWMRFTSLEQARVAIKQMYHDDRVLRAFVVTDDMPPQFVEWVER